MQRIIATLVECHSRLTALIKAAKMVVYLVTFDRRQKDFLVIENENCTAAYEARIKIKKSKTPNEELLRG